jgi:hypothetical protein
METKCVSLLGYLNNSLSTQMIYILTKLIYTALHDYTKWESVSVVDPKDKKYSEYAHRNFTECLLNSALQIPDSKATLEKDGLKVVHPAGWRVVYPNFHLFPSLALSILSCVCVCVCALTYQDI